MFMCQCYVYNLHVIIYMFIIYIFINYMFIIYMFIICMFIYLNSLLHLTILIAEY